MSRPVTIENDALRLEVWPQFGGKVASIIDKADKFELLFDYAAELPTTSLYDRRYSSGWYAGWDECFPAVAPGPYPGHPYDGVGVPDHGELWGLPASAEPTKNGITTTWHGLRFGYRFARNIALDGPRIVCTYTLTNLAPFEFRFVWSQHALLAMNAPVQLALPACDYRLSHDAAGHEINQTFRVGSAPQDLRDVARPSELPANRAWKLFALEPIDSPLVIRYPTRDAARQLSIAFTPADNLRAYWGIWLNTGGWEHHRHFAIEPTTGRFDDLTRAARDGSAGVVEPNGKREWTVTWTVG